MDYSRLPRMRIKQVLNVPLVSTMLERTFKYHLQWVAMCPNHRIQHLPHHKTKLKRRANSCKRRLKLCQWLHHHMKKVQNLANRFKENNLRQITTINHLSKLKIAPLKEKTKSQISWQTMSHLKYHKSCNPSQVGRTVPLTCIQNLTWSSANHETSNLLRSLTVCHKLICQSIKVLVHLLIQYLKGPVRNKRPTFCQICTHPEDYHRMSSKVLKDLDLPIGSWVQTGWTIHLQIKCVLHRIISMQMIRVGTIRWGTSMLPHLKRWLI